MENKYCPDLRPDEVDTPVGVGSGQRKVFDDFLPCQSIDTAVGKHEKSKHIEKRRCQAIFIILNGSQLGKDTRQRKKKDIQVKLDIFIYSFHNFSKSTPSIFTVCLTADII